MSAPFLFIPPGKTVCPQCHGTGECDCGMSPPCDLNGRDPDSLCPCPRCHGARLVDSPSTSSSDGPDCRPPSHSRVSVNGWGRRPFFGLVKPFRNLPIPRRGLDNGNDFVYSCAAVPVPVTRALCPTSGTLAPIFTRIFLYRSAIVAGHFRRIGNFFRLIANFFRGVWPC